MVTDTRKWGSGGRYGPAHRALRKRVRVSVDAGLAVCARCGFPIASSEPWDLGHDDVTGGYAGAEHRRCNRATSGRRRDQSRLW